MKLTTKTGRGGGSDGVMQRSQQIKSSEEDTRDNEVLVADPCANSEAHATTKVVLKVMDSSSTCGWDCHPIKPSLRSEERADKKAL